MNSNYSIIAVDIETANRYDRGSICQIAFVGSRDGKTETLFSSYVNPQTLIDPMLSQIHHITDADVKDAPTFAEIYPQIASILRNNVVIAHNASFDICALEKAMFDIGAEPIEILYGCSFQAAKSICSCEPVKSYKLCDLCEYFGIEQTSAHDACDDARCCALVTERLIKMSNSDSIETLMWRSGKRLYSSLTNSYSPEYEDVEALRREVIVRPNFTSDVVSGFAGKSTVITGTLHDYTKSEAYELIEKAGGIVRNEKGKLNSSVTKNTDVLIVGVQDLARTNNQEYSIKHRKALELREKGHSIAIIDELEFIRVIENV